MDFQKEIVCQEISRTGVRTILVPTDFSEYSDMALQKAIDIALQQNARIYLLHVERLTEKRTVDSPEILIRAQIGKFAEVNMVEIIPAIRKGSPYEEILKEQVEKGIDLIVIGSHGKKRLRHHLTENVATKIAKKVPCSVLLIGA
jgi:nucleotide-binding universal stress UspA family protein